MKEMHPSQNEEFFDRGPEEGSPEFEEAKKEAGTGDWFEVFGRNIELAQSKKDKILLENSVRAMEEDVSGAVARSMEKGDIVAARTVLNELEAFAKERHLDIKEILESERERVAQEKLDELKKMGIKGVMDITRELFRSDESPTEEDAHIIFGLTQSLLKNGAYETLEDAIIDAATKRWAARPQKSVLFVATDKKGYVSGGGKTRVEAAKKFRENA